MPSSTLGARMMSTENSFSMSSATGKQILSLIRDGDYAHAGEEEAITLTLEGLQPSKERKILDMGCGLGGTADYIARLGLGAVSGIDIDPETISYAQTRYPQHSFVCGPAGEASRYLHPGFDLVVIFNAIYSFPDQAAALREASRLATPGGEMRIFEYTSKSATPAFESFCERYGKGRWRPLVLDQAPELFQRNGWSLESVTDLSNRYEGWYASLVEKIEAKKDQIIARGGARWFDYTLRRYQELLNAIREDVVGGAIFKASKV